MNNYYIVNDKTEHKALINAKLFTERHIVTRRLFEADAYPFYFYTYPSNKRIAGWQPSIRRKSNAKYIKGLNLLSIDVLLHPDQYPEYFI